MRVRTLKLGKGEQVRKDEMDNLYSILFFRVLYFIQTERRTAQAIQYPSDVQDCQ